MSLKGQRNVRFEYSVPTHSELMSNSASALSIRDRGGGGGGGGGGARCVTPGSTAP